MADVAVHEQTGIRYYNPEKAYYEAEDRECAMMALDKAGVPRADDAGKVFSLLGRIMRFNEMPSNAKVSGARRASGLNEMLAVEDGNGTTLVCEIVVVALRKSRPSAD